VSCCRCARQHPPGPRGSGPRGYQGSGRMPCYEPSTMLRQGLLRCELLRAGAEQLPRSDGRPPPAAWCMGKACPELPQDGARMVLVERCSHISGHVPAAQRSYHLPALCTFYCMTSSVALSLPLPTHPIAAGMITPVQALAGGARLREQALLHVHAARVKHLPNAHKGTALYEVAHPR